MLRIFLLGLILLGLGGCVTKPDTYPSNSYLKLDLPDAKTLNIDPFDLNIGVSLPTGSTMMSNKIIYQERDGSRQEYAYHQWEDLLGSQIQEHFVLFFAKADILKDISSLGTQIDPDWILETHVVDFAQFMKDESSANVKVLARMRLVNAEDNKGLSSKLFSYEVPMQGLGPKALMKSFNKALKLWREDSLSWLIGVGENYAP